MSLYNGRIKNRLPSAFTISIILHVMFVLVLIVYPRKSPVIRQETSIPVEWVKNVPKPELKHKEQLKEPIKKQNNPERRVGRDAANKLQSQFDIDEVIKKSKS